MKKNHLLFGILCSIILLIIAHTAWAGLGGVVNKVKNQTTPSTGMHTSTTGTAPTPDDKARGIDTNQVYQADQAQRDSAEAKAQELDNFVQTLRGKSFESAVSSVSSRVGAQPIKNDGFMAKWLITSNNPSCVLVKLGRDNNKLVNSGSAWMTHAGDGSTCAADYPGNF